MCTCRAQKCVGVSECVRMCVCVCIWLGLGVKWCILCVYVGALQVRRCSVFFGSEGFHLDPKTNTGVLLCPLCAPARRHR